MSTHTRRSESIGRRKARHLEICTETSPSEVEGGQTYLDRVHLVHDALGELDWSDIDTTVEFLSTRVRTPLLISCMTGGSENGFRVNRELARAAQISGVPVGMGSIRILFDHPELFDHFHLKALAPDVPVLANLGIVQVRDRPHPQILELVRKLEADALVVHVNPAQELFQPKGDRDFRGVMEALAKLCASSTTPIIVKETGAGIGPSLVRELLAAGAAYVDIAGSGGTNWVKVEAYGQTPAEREEAQVFDDWGIPTGLILATLRLDGTPLDRVIASGGLRTGLDLARVLALGARLGGMALPMARVVASGGADAVVELVAKIDRTLRRVMLLTGSRDLNALRRGKVWLEPVLEESARSLRAAELEAGERGSP